MVSRPVYGSPNASCSLAGPFERASLLPNWSKVTIAAAATGKNNCRLKPISVLIKCALYSIVEWHRPVPGRRFYCARLHSTSRPPQWCKLNHCALFRLFVCVGWWVSVGLTIVFIAPHNSSQILRLSHDPVTHSLYLKLEETEMQRQRFCLFVQKCHKTKSK